MKKCTAFILVMTIILSLFGALVYAEESSSVWDGSIASGFESGSGTEADPYIIKTAPQLAYLAQSVNSGNNYSGKFIKLANDIVLNTPDMFEYDENGNITGAASGKTPQEWTAIGNNSSYFSGTFDGANHEVKGICINKPETDDYQGLLGYCYNSIVKNVGVTGGHIYGNIYVGGVVGYNVYGATVKHCYNTGTITGSYCEGGVVGGNFGTVENCHNTGTVTGYYPVGGVVGGNWGMVETCYNTGAVMGLGNVGGVAGDNHDTVINCHNTGSVTGNDCVGGIVSNNTGTATVASCYNTGNVMGTSHVGGVAGENWAYDGDNVVVVNSYNIGNVTGIDGVGGMVGYNGANGGTVTVENCYYLDGCITGNNGIGAALTDSQMRQQANFIGFDFDTVWTMAGNPDYPYPELRALYHGGYSETEETEISVWDGSIASGFESGSGTEADPYIIKTAPQLAYLAQSVNNGNTYEGKFIKLANDIVLNTPDMFATDENGNITGAASGKTPNEWAAIGTEYSSSHFSGTFDGANHEVKGIYINKPDAHYQGLFGYCQNATIKNVGVTGGYINGNTYVGSIVGYNEAYDGGTAKVANCYNTGNVTGANAVGGAVGWNYASDSSSAMVTNCYNTGTIIGNYYDIGGVVGANYVQDRGSSVVVCCYNTGAVTGISGEGGGVAGVVGDNYAPSGSATVENCYNIGMVTGYTEVGGVVGYNWDAVENCYYLDSCIAENNGIGTALSDSEMRRQANFIGFDFDTVWTMAGNPDYPYPELIGMLHSGYSETEETEISVWDGSVASGFESGSGTEADPYIIKTAPQLAYLAQSVNNGNTYEGQCIKLANDIVLNTPDMFATDENGNITGAADGKTPNEWTAIGTEKGHRCYFHGNFDGNNHEIQGIYINKPDTRHQGLFGHCYNATVKNVGVTYGYIYGEDYVGGVVGYNNGTGATVSNCYNTGAVSGQDFVGGVVGDCSTITNCYNVGAVSGANVGGVVGTNRFGVTNNCYNVGTVTGGANVGGVVGVMYSASSNISTIINCYNTGAVTGNDAVGGIVGFNLNMSSTYEKMIRNSYNIGVVTGDGTVGGIVGLNRESAVENCYYLDGCVAEHNGIGTALSDSEMRQQASFVGFDFDAVWTMAGNPDYPYPELIYMDYDGSFTHTEQPSSPKIIGTVSLPGGMTAPSGGLNVTLWFTDIPSQSSGGGGGGGGSNPHVNYAGVFYESGYNNALDLTKTFRTESSDWYNYGCDSVPKTFMTEIVIPEGQNSATYSVTLNDKYKQMDHGVFWYAYKTDSTEYFGGGRGGEVSFYKNGGAVQWNNTSIVLDNVIEKTMIKGTVTLPAHSDEITYTVYAEQNREIYDNFIEREKAYKCTVTVPAHQTVSEYEIAVPKNGDYYVYIVFENKEFVRQDTTILNFNKTTVVDFSDFETSDRYTGSIFIPDTLKALLTEEEKISGTLYLQSSEEPYLAIIDSKDFCLTKTDGAYSFDLANDTDFNDVIICFEADVLDIDYDLYPEGNYKNNSEVAHLTEYAKFMNGGLSDIQINLEDRPITSISREGLYLDKGEEMPLNAEITPIDTSDLCIIYSSLNPEIVTVDENGNLKAIADGTAQIKCHVPYLQRGSFIIPVTVGHPVHTHHFSDEWIEDIAATCTEKGIKSHHCGCGLRTDITEIDALGHNFVDGECTRCHIHLYSVNISYVYSNGAAAAESVDTVLLEGEEYSFNSPSIAGYIPDSPIISGTANGNISKTVTYTPVEASKIVEILDVDLSKKEYNTQYTALGLPSTVNAKTASGETVSLKVNWNRSDYNPTTYGVQRISGTVITNYGYMLDCENQVFATVEIAQNIIVSINKMSLGKLPINTPYSGLGLPSVAAVTTDKGSVYYMPVVWNTYEYDPTVAGIHTIYGTVSLEEGFSFATGVSNTAEISFELSEKMYGTADIVFVVDTTGSMWDEIQNVKNNINIFADNLEASGVSVRWALLEYRDITCDGMDSTKIKYCGSSEWYIDVDAYKAALAALKVSGGGDREETVIDALKMATLLGTREGTTRFDIVVTDADFKVNNRYGITDMSQMIEDLVENETVTSVVTKLCYYDVYRDLTDTTGGLLADIDGNFANELDKLRGLIEDEVVYGAVDHISVINLPDKTEYTSGDRFDGKGMIVRAYYESGSQRDVTGYSVSPYGHLGLSDRQIEIDYRGKSAYVDITVSQAEVPVTGISVNPEAISLEVGNVFDASVSVQPYNATNTEFVSETSNTNVAVVNGTQITAVGAGECEILFTSADGGFVSRIAVSVTKRTPLEEIYFNTGAVEMYIGDKYTVDVTYCPEDAYNKDLVWRSEDSSIVSVNNGVLTALKEGSATVSATSVEGGHSAYIYVTVVKKNRELQAMAGCGENVHWKLYDDGLLEIYGSGKMYDYQLLTSPWYSYRNDIKNVLIRDGITNIGSFAFMSCDKIENITIPDSVDYIGLFAFFGCHALGKIELPNSVKNMGNYAFAYCSSVNLIKLSQNLERISEYNFASCSSLTTVEIPESVTEIGDYAFYDCRNLVSASIPDLAKLGKNVFDGCDKLTIEESQPSAPDGHFGGGEELGSGTGLELNADFTENSTSITVSLTAEDIPDAAKIYVAAYDAFNRVKALEEAIFTNNSAALSVDKADTSKIKIFAWNPTTLFPYTESKLYNVE